jgi:hypothetical protein
MHFARPSMKMFGSNSRTQVQVVGKRLSQRLRETRKRLGVRWDYDGEVSKADGFYHRFQM